MSPLRKSEKEDLTENPVPPPPLYGTGQETDWNLNWRQADCGLQPVCTSPALGWSEIGAKPRGWGGGWQGSAMAGLLTLYR